MARQSSTSGTSSSSKSSSNAKEQVVIDPSGAVTKVKTTEGQTGGVVYAGGQTKYSQQTTTRDGMITGAVTQPGGQYTTPGQTHYVSGQQYGQQGATIPKQTTQTASGQKVYGSRYTSASLTPNASISNVQYSRNMSSTTLTGRETVISERIMEHEVKVPKRIVREDIVEKIIVVPEKIVHEEVIEETQKVREKIIEVAKPIYQEKIVEVPEIEYVEKIVEVVEKIVQEKIKEVPRIEIQERIVEIPKIITQEKVVEVPEYEYREVPFEKVVEVIETHEQVVVKEVPIPQYVEKPVPEYVTVEVPQKIQRNIPIPVEAVTTFEYGLPKIRPNYKKVKYPIYVPRFVEVPVPEELVAGTLGQQAAYLAQHVSLLTNQTAPSLCEVENIAADIKKMDLASHIASADYHATIQNMWSQNKLQIINSGQYGASRGISPSHQTGTTTSNQYLPVMYNTGGTSRKASSKVGHKRSGH